MLSRFSHVWHFVTPWTVAHQAPLSMGILQARILGWVAMHSSRGSSQPRDQTRVSSVSSIGRWVLYHQWHLGSLGCESWTIKKAEHRRIDAFKLWCWRTLLRVPSSARRSNHSILKEINPEYSLEGLMLKLKLQYFGYVIWTANSLEKTLMLGKIEGRRRRGWQRMRQLDGLIDSMDMSLSKLWEIVKDREAWCCSLWGRKELDMNEQQHNTQMNISSQLLP